VVQVERGGGFVTVVTAEVQAFQPEKIGVDVRGKTTFRGLINGETSLSYTVK
jgi:hypothetical protein